jgi:hypothetical protein
MTSQGTSHGRFQRAIQRRQLRAAEMAARELGGLNLAEALDLTLLMRDQTVGDMSVPLFGGSNGSLRSGDQRWPSSPWPAPPWPKSEGPGTGNSLSFPVLGPE